MINWQLSNSDGDRDQGGDAFLNLSVIIHLTTGQSI